MFLDKGKEYMFVSNIDNLGATVDVNILLVQSQLLKWLISLWKLLLSFFYIIHHILGDAFGGFFLEKSCSDALSDLFLLFKLTSAYVYTHVRTYFEGAV